VIDAAGGGGGFAYTQPFAAYAVPGQLLLLNGGACRRERWSDGSDVRELTSDHRAEEQGAPRASELGTSNLSRAHLQLVAAAGGEARTSGASPAGRS
jgi:hypothetical protein